jgi:hypothetical protein
VETVDGIRQWLQKRWCRIGWQIVMVEVVEGVEK